MEHRELVVRPRPSTEARAATQASTAMEVVVFDYTRVSWTVVVSVDANSSIDMCVDN